MLISGMDIASEANMAIEALFLLLNSGHETAGTLSVLKDCLQSVVMLCKVRSEACDQFVDIVGGMLHVVGPETMALLCEVLAALGDMKQGVLNLLLPDICHLISTAEPRSCVVMATLLFQSFKGHSWIPENLRALFRAYENLDMWSAYQMARAASRYGHHDVAHHIFTRLSSGVSSEHFYFWLVGLSQVSLGEKTINGIQDESMDLVRRLNVGNMHLLKGHASIKASTTPLRNQDFRLQYLRCRSEMLQVLVQTVTTCNSMKTSPPPAIANNQVKQTHDDLQRFGRVTQLLRQCVKDYATVGAMFGALYETSFDADNGTLAHLQVMQHLCQCVSQWIEVVCLKSSLQGNIFDDLDISFNPNLPKPASEYGIDVRGLIETGEKVAGLFKSSMKTPPISITHMQCLIQVVELLASEQLCIPRLFFQSLQTTNIKLAVTPQPRNPNEAIAVPSSQHMAIKVEGVITSSTSTTFRSIDAIQLSLKSMLQTASAKALQNEEVMSKISECNQSLEQVVVPHNDFFTAQFLLPFAMAGTYVVVIDTKLIDKDEQTWKQTGLSTVLNIKAFEDGQARMQGGRRQ